MNHIKCYIPPINISQLSDVIYVPVDDVYEYCKELYEKGREAKSVLPVEEFEAIEYFRWKASMSKLNKIKIWIIDKLIK